MVTRQDVSQFSTKKDTLKLECYNPNHPRNRYAMVKKFKKTEGAGIERQQSHPSERGKYVKSGKYSGKEGGFHVTP